MRNTYKYRKVLIITTKNDLSSVRTKIQENPNDRYLIDSFCVLDAQDIGTTVDDLFISCNQNNFINYLCHEWIDEIFIATDLANIKVGDYQLLKETGITLNTICKDSNGADVLYGYVVNRHSVNHKTLFQCFIKRLIDIIGALFGCLLTLIMILIIGPLICFYSPGPIFYKQERIGLNGRHFTIYKFRSMIINADDIKSEVMKNNIMDSDLMFKMKDDPRIIPKIGTFIRQTSIDEFPQFFNVLIGDMSLVGTRPPLVDEWEKYEPKHRIRMSIMPGISGLWQVSGRSRITSFDTAVEYDREYINNYSIMLDLNILVRTVLVLFKSKEGESL